MPFSWKKKKKTTTTTTTRCNRFSQLVADHLQTPKRGGSLVVETGFPTSVIDLYVRNRGRFRKSSAKKERENDCSSSPSSGLVLDSVNSSSSSTYAFVDSNDLSSSSGKKDDCRGTDDEIIEEVVEEDVVVGVGMVENGCEVRNSDKTEVERSVEMAKAAEKLNPALVVALKVLVVAVMVLRTKGFTIGITMSAFLLLLLELVGKLLFARSSSVSVGSKAPSDPGFRETENVISSKEDATLVVCSGVLEIEEQVGSNQEVGSEKELDEVRSEVLTEIRHKSSRRAIMKSRMKKLVPKKLRRSSMGSKEETSYGFIEEESVKSSRDLDTLVSSSECSDLKGETLRILNQNQDKIVEVEERSLSSTLSSEIDCNDKELGRDLHQNSGCLVMCLIVLVGLIGGRVLALVLALSWCLMLKKLQWRNVKVPIS